LIDNKQDIISYHLALDILSLFIFNHKFKSKLDPIFDSSSPFKQKKIKYIFKNCITYCNQKQVNLIIKIYPQLTDIYLECYHEILKNIEKINSIEYNITYEITNDMVIIKLNIINNILDLNYSDIKIPLHIFSHLVSLYNIKKYNNYTDKTILDETTINYIYILFTRYNLFESGNNQASILPSFKKLLKQYLNVKIELFGSPLNTSNVNYGSFFYDSEYMFGSLGNFFRTKICKFLLW
jgi:hypothetical protein